jgi:cytochrome c-type biogenesis protein CcmH/NrfG
MNEWLLIGLLVLLTVSASVVIVYPLRRELKLSFFVTLCMFVFAATGYYYWGGFSALQQFNKQQESKLLADNMLKSLKSTGELIDKLRAKLDDNPASAKGWFLLGRLYSSENQESYALKAYAKAYHFKPEEEEFAVNYAHSLWQINNKQFNIEIKAIFKTLLDKNPKQPDALSMLAMDAFVNHAYEKAIEYWQRLLVLAPEQSKEAKAIRKAIAKAQSEIGKI